MRRLTLLPLLLLLAACGRSKPPVILISIDTLRADHVPVAGAIASLKRDSVSFESAWSHCPMTLPSHVSMLTGLLPTEHGVRNNVGFTFDPQKHKTIAQALHDDGYATGAAVSAFVLRGRTGLRGAFDAYDDVDDPSHSAADLELERAGSETVERAMRWVDGVKEKPFFLFVHLFEPHAPYINGYDGDIATADAAVGQLIAALKQRGVYDDALIILTSDHGEGLGDHGEMQHSVLLYSEMLRVPMIVKLPHNDRRGTATAYPVQLADIAATIAGVTKTHFEHGQSMINGTPRTVYSETLFPRIHLGWSELTSVADSTHHYISGPKPELYDIRSDPRETHDVIGSDRRDAARMRELLTKFEAPMPKLESVDAETAASLAALGYVGSTQKSATQLNPRDHIAGYEAMRSDMADAILAERNDAAAAARIAARPNASAAALVVAARFALRNKRPTDALALLARAEKLAQRMPDLELARGNALMALSRYEEAERAFTLETQNFPQNLGAFATLATLQFAMNDKARGHAVLRAMYEKNPSREAAMLAARTCAAVEEMEEAARWSQLAGPSPGLRPPSPR